MGEHDLGERLGVREQAANQVGPDPRVCLDRPPLDGVERIGFGEHPRRHPEHAHIEHERRDHRHDRPGGPLVIEVGEASGDLGDVERVCGDAAGGEPFIRLRCRFDRVESQRAAHAGPRRARRRRARRRAASEAAWPRFKDASNPASRSIRAASACLAAAVCSNTVKRSRMVCSRCSSPSQARSWASAAAGHRLDEADR